MVETVEKTMLEHFMELIEKDKEFSESLYELWFEKDNKVGKIMGFVKVKERIGKIKIDDKEYSTYYWGSGEIWVFGKKPMLIDLGTIGSDNFFPVERHFYSEIKDRLEFLGVNG